MSKIKIHYAECVHNTKCGASLRGNVQNSSSKSSDFRKAVKIAQIKEKINHGNYLRPEIYKKVAEKIIDDFSSVSITVVNV